MPRHSSSTLEVLALLALLMAGPLLGSLAGSQEIITVELGEFYFEPSTITIPAGQTVRLVIMNLGSISHTFTVPGLNIDVTLGPGETVEIEVTAEEPGELELVCRFHIAQGMVGTVVVAQAQPVETVTVTETVTETVTITETQADPGAETVTVVETIVSTETVTTTLELTTTLERVVTQTETVTSTETVTDTTTVTIEEARLGVSALFLVIGILVGVAASFLLRRG